MTAVAMPRPSGVVVWLEATSETAFKTELLFFEADELFLLRPQQHVQASHRGGSGP